MARVMTMAVVALVVLLAAAFGFALFQWARIARARRTFDVGAVSTRWLSELRRDEPWTSS